MNFILPELFHVWARPPSIPILIRISQPSWIGQVKPGLNSPVKAKVNIRKSEIEYMKSECEYDFVLFHGLAEFELPRRLLKWKWIYEKWKLIYDKWKWIVISSFLNNFMVSWGLNSPGGCRSGGGGQLLLIHSTF